MKNDLAALSPAPTFLTYRQAAMYLTVSDRTLRRLVSDGAITYFRVGGQIRFTRDDVVAYLSSCRVAARLVGDKK